MFGSDYPHPEGLAESIGYFKYAEPSASEGNYHLQVRNGGRLSLRRSVEQRHERGREPRRDNERWRPVVKTASNAPANTQMMVIVHGALCRDLGRAKKVLASTPLPDAQRRALADQLQWMMQFLHHHHVSEDVGLYPLVRARTVDAEELLDVMEAEHQAIGPGLRAIQEESARFALGDEAGQSTQLLAAIDLLETALIPHLTHEENDFLPLVTSTLTSEEWQSWDQQYNIKPKSIFQLGFTTQWLLDDASVEDQNYIASVIPSFARLIMLRGFAFSYRRHSSRCWD